MVNIQLSLLGKTSWERFLQMTGWTIEPCWNPSQIPAFQCLLLEDGQTPEWCEGEALTSPGGLWIPVHGECHSEGSVSFSWQILEDSVPEKFYLSPGLCSKILRLAQKAGCPPPPEIEYLLKKQGGRCPSSIPFRTGACGERQRNRTRLRSSAALEGQQTLFPPSWPKQ